MTPATIHLVRHATHATVGHALAGRRPGIGLDENGRAQAGRLAARFRAAPPDLVVSSPVQRAMETARPIAAACGLETVEELGLQEIDFGAWTGQSFAALADDPAWMAWNRGRGLAQAPGGEAMHQAQSRALLSLEAIRARVAGGTAVAVSHADIIRGVLCAVLGMPLDAILRLSIDPASVTILRLWPERGEVVGVNHPA